MRKAFIKTVRSELDRDQALMVFLGDISVAGFLSPEDKLIDRVFNCGILEQAMTSFAAGCASAGFYPIVQTIIPFLVERAFEQIKLDFCAQRHRGLIVGVGGGLEYSKLGSTHHTLWDTALLSNLEGLTLFTPTVGAAEVETILRSFISERELAYARLTELYLTASCDEPYRVAHLNKLKSGDRNCTTATVLCGAFPGIQKTYNAATGDVYAYSYPNRAPLNVAVLAAYSEVRVWEFGTAPMLRRAIAAALPGVAVSGFHQSPAFFRSYGSGDALDFIESNWVESR
jgi:hypothetical protein